MVNEGRWRKSWGSELGLKGTSWKKRQRLISGLYRSLKCNPTVLPVQGIWTPFSTPSAGAQRLGEVTWQLGFGGEGGLGISQVVLLRVWPLT